MLQENNELPKGWTEALEIQSLEIFLYYNQTTGYSLWTRHNNEHFVTDVTDVVAEPSADKIVETDECEQIDF